MKEIVILGNGLSEMCRLCLTWDVTMVHIFSYSTRLKAQIVDAILKCTPVQITKNDDMPPYICKTCYFQLENIHQFQMQVINSEKTLRSYLQQLHSSKRQNKSESAAEKPADNEKPSDNPLNYNSDAKLSELSEASDSSDTTFYRKVETLVNYTSNEINETESMDDNNTSISGEYVECIAETSSNEKDIEISNEDTNIDINTKVGVGLWQNFDHLYCAQVYPLRFEELTEEKSLQSENNPLNPIEYGSEVSFEETKIEITNTKVTPNTSESFEDQRSTEVIKDIRFYEDDSKKSTQKKTYRCDVCRKSYSRINKLNAHKRTHVLCQCDVCNKNFDKQSSLRIHIKRTHTLKRYQCDVRSKSFSRLSALNNHKLEHTDEKSYRCDVCNKTFTMRNELKRHRRIHTGEKPYQCDVCNEHFTLLSNLNSHTRIHIGAKPYKCDVCDKSFFYSASLIMHTFTHTGEKPYRCDVCNKSYYAKQSLKSHQRIHTSEKPYTY